MSNLVIVESPAKCKKIESFLGSDYIVRASFGHIRDLESKSLSIDISDSFKPSYKILDSKRKVVNELIKYAKSAKNIILATDKDREGEAIAWHVYCILKNKISHTLNFSRVTFNSITKSAIQEAFSDTSKSIDIPMVRAQEARRVLDRLLGYGLCGVIRNCTRENKQHVHT